MVDVKRYTEEDIQRVKLREEPGDEPGSEREPFMCDEEPHMLSPELGFGFNPLKLGDRLKGGIVLGGTYEIVRKLGYGGNSSVWLAKLTDSSNTEKEFFALKVLTVNLTASITQHEYWELDCTRKVANTNPDHPGYKHCLTLREVFVCKSYHGPHISLAFDVLGSDMLALRRMQPNRSFSPHVTKRIIKQVLLALDYLHGDCRLVHRDVKPQNIMVAINASDATIAAYLEKNPSSQYEPRIEPRISPDPIITVKSQPLPDFDVDLDSINVKLADYGEAIAIEDIEIDDESQPVLLRAPEVMLGHPWSTPIDIWSVGCIVFEHLTGAALFELYESHVFTVTDFHLLRMTEYLGDFPPAFLERCILRDTYFNKEGKLRRIKSAKSRSIEECLANYKHMHESDVPPAAAFIRRCLTLDPYARPSAAELLQDEWLSGV